MQGRNTLWMPGTDHAGIATQAVVEKLLLTSEDKTFKRREYGREKLVAKIWEWKEKYEARILGQLKEIGCLVAIGNAPRFTLRRNVRAKAVRETFFRMFKRRLHLPRQAARELGHATANQRGRRRNLHRNNKGRLLDVPV